VLQRVIQMDCVSPLLGTLAQMVVLENATFTLLLVPHVVYPYLLIFITSVMELATVLQVPLRPPPLPRCPFRSLRALPPRRQRLLLLPALTAQQPVKLCQLLS
jgi:hypothetical protein